MYKIKQNVSFGFNLLISFSLSGLLQVAALSQAQAKLSPGDSLVERMKRGEVQGEMIQSQSLETKVVSKAILNDEEGQPLCQVDISENPDLSPPFATPAPPDFNSALSVDLRPCDLSEMGFIRNMAENAVLGPTKVALAPVILGWALLACASAVLGAVGVDGLANAADTDTAADTSSDIFGIIVGILGPAIASGAAAGTTTAGGGPAAAAGGGPVAAAALACFGGTLYFLSEDKDQ